METKNFKRITITLPKDLEKQFKKYCQNNGFKVSSKIANLISKELKLNNKEKE